MSVPEQFVNEQPFEDIAAAGGILPFQQSPFFAVLVRNIGEQYCPCQYVSLLVCNIGGLGLYRIPVEPLPVSVRHA